MCHLVLFLPVFALVVFWLLPWPLAAAIYLCVLLVSGWLYYVVFKLMHRPSLIGLHTLLGRAGTVVRSDGSSGFARVGRELWQFESERRLRPDEPVVVTGRRGFVLQVAPATASGTREPRSVRPRS